MGKKDKEDNKDKAQNDNKDGLSEEAKEKDTASGAPGSETDPFKSNKDTINS